MARYKITGEIHRVGDTQQITAKFVKRDLVLVLDKDSEYPQYIGIEAVQSDTECLDGYKQGEQVAVSFELRGREWTSPKDGVVKVFTSLKMLDVELVGPANTGAGSGAEVPF